MGQLLAAFNQRKVGSLPLDTIQNPKKDGHFMAITMRSGKVFPEPIIPSNVGMDKAKGKMPDLVEMHVDDKSDEVEVIPAEAEVAKETQESNKLLTQPLLAISKPPPPFPQRLKKKVEDGKF
ncbi:MAG: hypothetical protein Q8830_02770 [Candidatus Phytoplasma australasiaticum]|nr:hypothetical protein [Candidatus Phytoplasma australasiaticum]